MFKHNTFELNDPHIESIICFKILRECAIDANDVKATPMYTVQYVEKHFVKR